MKSLDKLANKCLEICNKKNWKRGWSHAGCYLHLEVSEFIESLRGKCKDIPEKEAADILFVLLSTMKANNVSIKKTINELVKLVEE